MSETETGALIVASADAVPIQTKVCTTCKGWGKQYPPVVKPEAYDDCIHCRGAGVTLLSGAVIPRLAVPR